jgi:DNA polymerase-3 subunit gamma/tau
MSQALYRKYRSTSFDELVGQEHVTELLKSAVKNGTFSHAYLFTGQRGTGKTSAARILAYAINELPYDADAGHLDIIEIDAASNRRIDDIRDLREKVFIAPVSAKYKVYIIDEVHMLTGESFNALLKTIEEPPAHAVFILATTELHKVPATIISRTQRFHFRPVSLAKVVEHLTMIAKKEKIDIDDEALKLIAEHGGGSFRDSISLLDQLGSLEGKVTAATVESILGRARSTDIATILQLLKDGKQAELHTLLCDMLTQGISPVTLSEQLVATLLHEKEASAESYELSEKLMSVPKAHFPQLLLMTTLLGSIAKKDVVKEEGRASQEVISAANTSSVDTSATSQQRGAKEKQLAQRGVETDDSASEQPKNLDDGSGQEKKKRPNKPSEELQQENNSTKSTAKKEFNWEAVLAATKKTNPALHSVLSRAEMRLDGNDLHLGFQYALHRKKLEQAEYRTQLMRIILDVCNLSVELHIEVAGQQLAADDHAKQVADLMGGGERVTV